jgi:hypothetical protein
MRHGGGAPTPCANERQGILRNLDRYERHLRKTGRMTGAVAEAIRTAKTARAGHELVFYIAGPLTGMPDDVKARYVTVSQVLAAHDRPGARMFGYAPHLHGTDPVRHLNVTPAEVRDIDYLYASVVCDYHINFVDPLAHGNAIEEGWAEEARVLTYYLVPEGVRLSRLILGMRNIAGIIRYEEFEADGLAQLRQVIEQIEVQCLAGTRVGRFAPVRAWFARRGYA